MKKPVHTEKPLWFVRTKPEEGEVFANGVYVLNEFEDKEGVLERAFEDFDLFLTIYGIKGDRFPIYIKAGQTSCFEEYKIVVTENECTIISADTEGVRRALIYIEDEFNRMEGAILPIGEIRRKPRIKKRITRGFFSPTNRPPLNIDELSNDVDYYPEEYLNRIAHDGTNGLWIYTRLSDLVKTSILPEYGAGSEKRIEKLRKIIKRCKKYLYGACG